MTGCKHERLAFGSGDYYIFCKQCTRGWVMFGENDIAAPELAGPGSDDPNLVMVPEVPEAEEK